MTTTQSPVVPAQPFATTPPQYCGAYATIKLFYNMHATSRLYCDPNTEKDAVQNHTCGQQGCRVQRAWTPAVEAGCDFHSHGEMGGAMKQRPMFLLDDNGDAVNESCIVPSYSAVHLRFRNGGSNLVSSLCDNRLL